MILQAPQPLILNSLKSIIVERRLFKIYNHWQRFVKSHNYWETVHAPGVVRKALTVEKRPSPNTEEKLNHHRWCRTLHQDGQSICKFQKSLIRTKKKKKTTGPNICLSTVALVYYYFFKKIKLMFLLSASSVVKFFVLLGILSELSLHFKRAGRTWTRDMLRFYIS